jgi:hypothetical protein
VGAGLPAMASVQTPQYSVMPQKKARMFNHAGLFAFLISNQCLLSSFDIARSCFS